MWLCFQEFPCCFHQSNGHQRLNSLSGLSIENWFCSWTVRFLTVRRLLTWLTSTQSCFQDVISESIVFPLQIITDSVSYCTGYSPAIALYYNCWWQTLRCHAAVSRYTKNGMNLRSQTDPLNCHDVTPCTLDREIVSVSGQVWEYVSVSKQQQVTKKGSATLTENQHFPQEKSAAHNILQ